jgi:hypothetical protein
LNAPSTVSIWFANFFVILWSVRHVGEGQTKSKHDCEKINIWLHLIRFLRIQLAELFSEQF